MQKMLNAVCSFLLSKFCTESDNINRSWITTEERLKYAICQVAYKSSNDPQFSKYQKLNPRKKRRVLRNTYEQTGPLINHIAEIGTFAQVAKTIYSFLPKDIRK